MAGKKNADVLRGFQPYEAPELEHKATRSAGITELPVEWVTTNPLNKRTDADEDQAELEEMAGTIRQHGVLQPLIVVTAAAFTNAYPDQAQAVGQARWVTLIGNRRLVAAKRAECTTVPGIVNDDRTGSMFEVMLVENSNRRDLAPLREAEAIKLVIDGGVSRRELSKRIGRTHTYVNDRIALLGLIPPLREALEAGKLTVERARDLGRADPEEQQKAVDAGPPSYRPSGNGVSSPPSRRRPTIPAGDPAAAARSIREVYTGDELAELVRLLSDPA